MSSNQTIAVLDENELKNGEMKEVDFVDGKVLLSKVGGKIFANSAFCTHYGAPLSKGVLDSSGRIVCPWHGACFNACTGDIEDAPAIRPLHHFETSIKDGKILVTANSRFTTKDNIRAELPSAAVPVTSEGRVVIVGGGSGSYGAILGLRENGYEGEILVISSEPHAPIDRTKISKALATDPEQLQLVSSSDLKEKLHVDFESGKTVSKVDLKAKKVYIDGDRKAIDYAKLIIATGASPNRLPVEGADLPHVHLLRSIEDAKSLSSVLQEGKKLVVIGSSFIGMELVVAVQQKKLASIDVISMTKYPFEAVLGSQVGASLQKFHESKGVNFHGETTVSRITSDAVYFKDRSDTEHEVQADVVVMAVGVKPNTKFLEEAGVSLRKDGGVVVDQFNQVNGFKDVYAIGDVAVFPEKTTGKQTRIEHWNVAQNHGRSVARHIIGKNEPFEKVPIFWSAQGQQLRYVGHAAEYDDVIIEGNTDEMKFVAYYVKGDKVLAVASMQSDPIAMHSSELIRLGKMLSASEIRAGKKPTDVTL